MHFCSQRPPSWCFIESHFHMLNDLQLPSMASEDKHHVLRPRICGVKEHKLLVHFCSQRSPSWCFIESHFHMLNDLQRPPMASEVGSDVIRSPICGVKEQKLLVHFCSQRPPSWCFSTPSLEQEEEDPWQFIGLRGTQAKIESNSF